MCNLPQTPLFAILNPDGSRGIVNVQPSNTVNTHRSNFPNNVKKKIDSNVNIPVSSNHFADFIRSANLSNCQPYLTIICLNFIRVLMFQTSKLQFQL